MSKWKRVALTFADRDEALDLLEEAVISRPETLNDGACTCWACRARAFLDKFREEHKIHCNRCGHEMIWSHPSGFCECCQLERYQGLEWAGIDYRRAVREALLDIAHRLEDKT